MATSKKKSYADRLVEMNRGNKKPHGRTRAKASRRHLPPGGRLDGDDLPIDLPIEPEAAVAFAETEYEDPQEDQGSGGMQEEVEFPPSPVSFPDSDAEDLLDELVSEPFQAAPSSNADSPIPAVPSKGTVGRGIPEDASLYRNDPRFKRPQSGPLRPSSTSNNDATEPGQVVINLTANLLRKLLSQKPADQPLRGYLVKRLTDCQDHTSEKGIYLSDAHLRKIQQFAHRDFSSAEELVGWLVSSADVFVGSQSLDVEPYLMQRVADRKPPELSTAEWLSELLTYGIMEKFGMR